MIDIIKEGLTNKANGGLLIILCVMITTIYGIHSFSKDERKKTEIKIEKILEIIEAQKLKIFELDKLIHIHIAIEEKNKN